jgi:predicted Zn-ribbon and HTH transcriptional regulator
MFIPMAIRKRLERDASYGFLPWELREIIVGEDDEYVVRPVECGSCGETIYPDTVEEGLCPCCGLDVRGKRSAIPN